MNAVSPNVNESLAAEITTHPSIVFPGPLFLEPDDYIRTQPVGISHEGLECLGEVAGGNSHEVQPRQQLIDRLTTPQVRRQNRGAEANWLSIVVRVVAYTW